MSGTSLQERLGASIFRLVAGPDGEAERRRIHGTPGPRWFPRDSAIARVHGDTSMFVGGLRALMVQTLHPAAMTAVDQHSGFRGDLFGRLARTSTFLATTTFAAEPDAERAVAVVRAVHESVRGTLADGTPYAASDPRLLAWVHVAEVESFLLAHQVFGRRPLDETGCDAYVAEAAVVARKLGVLDPPTSLAALHAELAAFRPELGAIPAARSALAHLRHEAPLAAPARPAYAALWSAAVSLVPRWARAELGLPDRPLLDRTVHRALGRSATAAIRWAMAPGRVATRAIEPADY
ncbi:MAG: oxygenase MpaB family protein [Nocardioides sp.]